MTVHAVAAVAQAVHLPFSNLVVPKVVFFFGFCTSKNTKKCFHFAHPMKCSTVLLSWAPFFFGGVLVCLCISTKTLQNKVFLGGVLFALHLKYLQNSFFFTGHPFFWE